MNVSECPSTVVFRHERMQTLSVIKERLMRTDHPYVRTIEVCPMCYSDLDKGVCTYRMAHDKVRQYYLPEEKLRYTPLDERLLPPETP